MHTVLHKKRLIARIRRIKGQMEAVERALTEEKGCDAVVQTIAAARGAMNSLAAEVLCEHIEEHVADAKLTRAARRAAAEELSLVIRRFIA